MGSQKVPGIPLLIAFCDIDGFVHREFVPPGHFYVQVLHGLRDTACVHARILL
jgi:hypothetical protein